jgi:uncharacterized protein (DUF1800 family)
MTTATPLKPKPSLLQRVRERFRREHDLSKPTSPQALSLTLALRRLWADHVIWTGSTWSLRSPTRQTPGPSQAGC